jgi:hypothetical protein
MDRWFYNKNDMSQNICEKLVWGTIAAVVCLFCINSGSPVSSDEKKMGQLCL